LGLHSVFVGHALYGLGDKALSVCQPYLLSEGGLAPYDKALGFSRKRVQQRKGSALVKFVRFRYGVVNKVFQPDLFPIGNLRRSLPNFPCAFYMIRSVVNKVKIESVPVRGVEINLFGFVI
jgi:hypothetical protein